MLKIWFFLGLNFVTISLDSSYVKNHFLGPSWLVFFSPLGPLFLFFLLFFLPLFVFLLAFYFFIFCLFYFLMFFIFFFHFFRRKSFFFSLFMYFFQIIFLLALVSEFNCFLRCRCSMEMWCPDDMAGLLGLGWAACLGESMLQLPRVGWRLLPCQNGASPDCIIVVVVSECVVVVVVVLLLLVVLVVVVCFVFVFVFVTFSLRSLCMSTRAHELIGSVCRPTRSPAPVSDTGAPKNLRHLTTANLVNLEEIITSISQ